MAIFYPYATGWGWFAFAVVCDTGEPMTATPPPEQEPSAPEMPPQSHDDWAPQRYFFDRGLHFECTRCGHCCTGDPGIVFVDPEELPALTAHLGMSANALIEQYLAPWRDGYTIRETEDGDCRFFEEGCRIYSLRPAQCRTWPFWIQNLRSQERWSQVARSCPGIGRGRRYSRDEILTLVSEL